MKTPWRIKDWNRDRISAAFIVVCALIIGAVVVLRINAPVHDQKHFIEKPSVKAPGGFFVQTGEDGGWNFISDGTTKEQAILNLQEENAALKKRIDELESGSWVGKATNNVKWGRIHITNSWVASDNDYVLDPKTMTWVERFPPSFFLP